MLVGVSVHHTMLIYSFTPLAVNQSTHGFGLKKLSHIDTERTCKTAQPITLINTDELIECFIYP